MSTSEQIEPILYRHFFYIHIQSTSLSKNTIATIPKTNLNLRPINNIIDNSKMLPLPTVVDLENSQSPNSNHESFFSNLPIISTTKVYSMASTCDTNEKL